MSYHVIIPARLASTRLPGKVLLDIAGKPMLQHVFDCAKASKAKSIIVATDAESIYQAAESFGAQACLTSEKHQTGSDRIAEVVHEMNFADDEIVVGVQADEPLIPASIINQVAENITKAGVEMASLCVPITDNDEIINTDVVKVVRDQNNYALYFSRASIPWDRDEQGDTTVYRHIGIYAYRVSFIKQFANWPQSPLEKTERLEQLRALWQGFKIHVDDAIAPPGIGIDSEDDLTRIRQHMEL